jgi:hypothetical protein
MSLRQLAIPFILLTANFLGCGDSKTVIPNAPFTEEQKKAIQAEDAKIADEESHGQNKAKKK